jgi:hypothetical protein
MPSGSRDSKLMISTIDDRELLRALKGLDKAINKEIRDHVRPMSEALARDLIQSAHGASGLVPPQAALIAPTIKARSDRMVRVQMGGEKKVGRAWGGKNGKPKKQATAGWLLYGAEHGSSGKPNDRTRRTMGRRFVFPHLGSKWWVHPQRTAEHAGYFIAPVVFHHGKEIAEKWQTYIKQIIAREGLNG